MFVRAVQIYGRGIMMSTPRMHPRRSGRGGAQAVEAINRVHGSVKNEPVACRCRCRPAAAAEASAAAAASSAPPAGPAQPAAAGSSSEGGAAAQSPAKSRRTASARICRYAIYRQGRRQA